MGETINRLRWHLFKAINRLNWIICPQPQRSRLHYDFNVRFGQIKSYYEDAGEMGKPDSTGTASVDRGALPRREGR
jgi:hypothetical protein